MLMIVVIVDIMFMLFLIVVGGVIRFKFVFVY